MQRLIGPFGLSDKDPQGLQLEGFEHLPVIATATNRISCHQCWKPKA